MYLTHLHNFRGVAICGIVGAHALHNFYWGDPPSESWTFRIADSLFNQSSVWFFFIAGFLFQYLSPRFSTAKYYKSKLKNVVLPYLVMSIPALYASIWMVRQDGVPDGFYDLPRWQQALGFLITGKHLAPFWFVPTISLIYLAAPLLLALDRRVWPYWFLPGLMALSAWLGRDGLHAAADLNGYYAAVSKATYLLSVYVFGMLCGRFHDQLLVLMKRFWLPVAAASLGCYLAHAFLYYEAPQDAKPWHWMYFWKITSSAVLVYALHVFDAHIPRWVGFLGGLSFGLFFVHGYVLAAQKMIWERFDWPWVQGNVFSYVAFSLLVIAICAALLRLTQKILGKRSRMVVGC